MAHACMRGSGPGGTVEMHTNHFGAEKLRRISARCKNHAGKFSDRSEEFFFLDLENVIDQLYISYQLISYPPNCPDYRTFARSP